MKNKQIKKRAFSLIETSIALVIMALIVSSMMGIFNQGTQLGKKTKNKAVLHSLAREVMEEYFSWGKLDALDGTVDGRVFPSTPNVYTNPRPGDAPVLNGITYQVQVVTSAVAGFSDDELSQVDVIISGDGESYRLSSLHSYGAASGSVSNLVLAPGSGTPCFGRGFSYPVNIDISNTGDVPLTQANANISAWNVGGWTGRLDRDNDPIPFSVNPGEIKTISFLYLLWNGPMNGIERTIHARLEIPPRNPIGSVLTSNGFYLQCTDNTSANCHDLYCKEGGAQACPPKPNCPTCAAGCP
jgi:prepilin-type N-terminal cleavage/methylation domain-containing protein